ncbi:CheR family methyltransferase [Opitutus terrae]|uniref:protein-glutamate O-methyltransferase n=1 Tax=Opitutus terrae (strain DSM 11246 / JCM 15787 / PB90-1) TaxID=452637 RepID=B1ZY72_OPITP|nr:protein-glutamate O-methyltransferase CheR [Opitutus terrae]ACB76218.1 MCP methyltransferase, CheR-type [Opitutus terrae PB90-1]
MTTPRAPGDAAALLVSEPVPKLLRDLIHERTGLYFEPERFDTMLEKLQPRASALGCTSYLDYYYILKYDENGPEEWHRVLDAFSVQETYFWREFDQIRWLVDYVVPQWFSRHTEPLRIWSAACATGEEPYSIAMALQNGGWGHHPIEIIASDASEAALAKARAGIYRERSFRSLPPELRAKYFSPSPQGDVLNQEVRNKVEFRWANLMSPSDYPDLRDLQAVFCRNVFIYFSAAAITRVVAAMAVGLQPRSHLFVGASESLLKLTSDFELQEHQGVFVYVRKAGS